MEGIQPGVFVKNFARIIINAVCTSEHLTLRFYMRLCHITEVWFERTESSTCIYWHFVWLMLG